MDKIRLNNVQIYAYHGLFNEEKQLGQKFQIDVEISSNLKKSCYTDNIDDTINYKDVYNIITSCFANHKKNLIESLAEDMANQILNINGVVDTTIIIRKPSVPIDGICDSVEIEIFRTKNG